MSEFNFNIYQDKILEIADMSWLINDINLIYISKTNNANWLYPELGIYIETDFDTVELYYKTTDEIKISKAYNSLISAISNINQNFKSFFPECFNLEKVKQNKCKNQLLGCQVILTFREKEYKIATSKNCLK